MEWEPGIQKRRTLADRFRFRIPGGSQKENDQKKTWSDNNVFRCDLASLYEGVSVRPSVRPSVGRSVTPSDFRRFRRASEHRVASIGSCLKQKAILLDASSLITGVLKISSEEVSPHDFFSQMVDDRIL